MEPRLPTHHCGWRPGDSPALFKRQALNQICHGLSPPLTQLPSGHSSWRDILCRCCLRHPEEAERWSHKQTILTAPPFSHTHSRPSTKLMVSANEKSTEGIKLSAPPHPLHTAIRFLINLPATGQQRVQLRLGIIRPLLPALHTPACRSEPGFVTLARAILTSGAAGNQACHRQIAWLGAKRIAPDLWPDF